MKDLGKPGAGELHARFDERGLETEHGLGTAAPATTCVEGTPSVFPVQDSGLEVFGKGPSFFL
jgi:hypothetical protein